MKQIRVLDNRGQEYLFPLDKPVMEVSIGRSQNNDIVLNSKTVSRRHAIIKLMGERVMLVNQSANGVFVNGERVERVRELRLGEFAAIEPYRFCVEATGPGAQPSVAPRGYGPGNGRANQPPGGRAGTPAAMSSVSAATATAALPERRPVAPAPKKKKPAETVEELLGDLAPNPDYQEQRVSLRGEEVVIHEKKVRQAFIGFKSELHDELKERLDLHSFQITDYSSPRVVRQVSEKLKELIARRQREIPRPYTPDQVFKEMMDEVCGLGPIEDLVKHRGVSEIMVVDREHIYAELNGKIVLTDRIFNDEKSMMTVIERIVIPRGRRIDESNPLVDTRLADGSRVNAVIPPLALKDPCLTIRKFPDERLTVKDLINFGSMTDEMAKFLARAVRSKKNIVISGGTGSGKTTLLNVLSGFIGQTERVVTIEDAAELQIYQEHVISLETKPPNLEGKGEIGIRELVKNALRMRPDRIVVGECRGGEALDMLQAMNTGHDGSMTTVHSNSPTEAIARLETLVLMSGMELPTRAIREQIAGSVDVIIQQSRFMDGSRRITYITEVLGIDDDGFVKLEDIYRYRQKGINEKGKVYGYHMATGYLPSFLDEFLIKGLADPEDFF
ncbi:pilus assembly protein TadA [Lujinxingia litoralis]|uniref:Pilus assembly protein TadA n=1 Tax=Lujinxingia litoralis TaxID=2211119 RepID=A0A328C8P8_9DELT|nr:ATPase, T2SS/T4P/T4SS family [Lujinxingia litoralis]RAL24815.1 pilus assembly protein TadA [Lujinxingia litoralis]